MTDREPLGSPANLIDWIASRSSVRAVADAAGSRRRVVATGAIGSSTALTAGALTRLASRPVILVVAHIDDADEALDELTGLGVPALRLPAIEALPGETGASLDLFAERLNVVRASLLMHADAKGDSAAPVIIAPIAALMQSVPQPARLDSLARTLARGQSVNLTDLARWLTEAGYKRLEAIEEVGDFSLRGGILDIFPPGAGGGSIAASLSLSSAQSPVPSALSFSDPGVPVRIDFFGDDIDKITEIDLETMGSDRVVDAIQLVAADPALIQGDDRGVNFLELLPERCIAALAETMEVVEQGRGYYERITDARGIYGPPAVLKLLETRFHSLVEINQFSAGAATADARADLPVSPLPSFPRDAGEAVQELAFMSGVEVAPPPAASTPDNAESSKTPPLTSEKPAATRKPGKARAITTGANVLNVPAPTAAEPSFNPNATHILVACQNAGEQQRLGELLTEFAPAAKDRIRSIIAYIHRGFVWHDEATELRHQSATSSDTNSNTSSLRHSVTSSLSVVPYHELLNRFTTRRRAARIRSGRAMDTFLDFAPGDYVVHTEHGIALFSGLTMMKPRVLPGQNRPTLPGEAKAKQAEQEEYLTLEFAGKARLHVPVTKIDQVQKYVGGFAGKPPLSTLGGQKWKNQKERTAESVKDLAAEMLRVRAAREHMPGIRYPGDTPWQNEFEAEFPYTETEDQLSGLAAIKQDMARERPMDRLICGDVGFGKTELAIRAAFKAAEFGKQIAVLVPTTVLAEQHERTFRSRFAGYPFRIESLSRFKSDKEAKETLAALRKGQVDLVIGTHRLLSQDVEFSDLGLVIVDEEQRFGVEHKERLLRLRMTVDVLTLSATPIPRTLHMAMLGIRDISSLTTAPLDRRAIVTEVIPYNQRRIQQAIARELSRDGQVFFVHNRVHDILSVADDVQKLAPEARIVIGHGQMAPHDLEEVMLKFMRGDADILVSTTIIESGIDIPTANTMIINDADRFGLAELHQLRGRVGRSKHRAYCYMLLPAERTVKEIAQKRLKAIEQYSMLGAGFKIAMRDLEIRGAGNILGAEQSGHIAAVGYEMYCHLLETAVHELKNEKPPEPASSTSVEIGLSGTIPKTYIPSDQRRLEAYRRLATSSTIDEVKQVETDLTAAYGDPPKQVHKILNLAQLRVLAASLEVKTITIREKDVVFLTKTPRPLADRLSVAPKGVGKEIEATVRILDPKEPNLPAEVYFRPPEKYLEPETLLMVLKKRLLPPTAIAEPAPPPTAPINKPLPPSPMPKGIIGGRKRS